LIYLYGRRYTYGLNYRRSVDTLRAMAKKRAEKMLTVREAAEKIGASSISVRIWASKGRFPGAELDTSSPRGAVWLIPETALEGFEMGKAGRPAKKKGKAK